MMRDPDMGRAPTNGHTRAFILPSGGSLEIPMPTSKSSSIKVRPPRGLGEAVHESKLPLIIGVVIGVAIGGTVVAWYLRRK